LARATLTGPGKPSRASRSPRQSAFSEHLAETAEQAAAAAGGFTEHHYQLAGRRLHLRFAGPALEGLKTALSHLESEATAEPDLTISVWDRRSTSCAPRPAWDNDAYRERGVIREFFEPGFYTLYRNWDKTLMVLDADRRAAYYWMDEAQLEIWDRGAPFRTLLQLWLSGEGAEIVHTAAVGRADGCLLAVGNSGAGKSSTALACLGSSLRHIGEDHCVLTPGRVPLISSLYCSAKVEADTLERMPELRRLAVADAGPRYDKYLLDLGSLSSKRLLSAAPLRAIALPHISEEAGTTVTACSHGEALAAVAPSTLMQVPWTGEEAMGRLTEMVAAVPCYRVAVGSDPSRIPPALESLLEPA
jgi:hypothetical protein